METTTAKKFPKLHNAMWPGIVGKGGGTGESPISLDTMLAMTAQAEVNGVKFDGVDMFLYDPHVNIDSSDDDIKRLGDNIAGRSLDVGAVVAPVWTPTGGGCAFGEPDERKKFGEQIRKACCIAQKLDQHGVRKDGVVRMDTAGDVVRWRENSSRNTKRIISTFKEACRVAAGHGQSLVIEPEICWGGIHSWQHLLAVLEGVNDPEHLGCQADLAHLYLLLLGYNAPGKKAFLSAGHTAAEFNEANRKMADQLVGWVTDVHVALNDGTVKGSGSHDKTGRHCLPDDIDGKFDIVQAAGPWLADAQGKDMQSICWDGCMFPNAILLNPATWNNILDTMIKVREAHGWN